MHFDHSTSQAIKDSSPILKIGSFIKLKVLQILEHFYVCNNFMAGEEGLEPSIFGARNRRLTNLATRHYYGRSR